MADLNYALNVLYCLENLSILLSNYMNGKEIDSEQFRITKKIIRNNKRDVVLALTSSMLTNNFDDIIEILMDDVLSEILSSSSDSHTPKNFDEFYMDKMLYKNKHIIVEDIVESKRTDYNWIIEQIRNKISHSDFLIEEKLIKISVIHQDGNFVKCSFNVEWLQTLVLGTFSNKGRSNKVGSSELIMIGNDCDNEFDVLRLDIIKDFDESFELQSLIELLVKSLKVVNESGVIGSRRLIVRQHLLDLLGEDNDKLSISFIDLINNYPHEEMGGIDYKKKYNLAVMDYDQIRCSTISYKGSISLLNILPTMLSMSSILDYEKINYYLHYIRNHIFIAFLSHFFNYVREVREYNIIDSLDAYVVSPYGNPFTNSTLYNKFRNSLAHCRYSITYDFAKEKYDIYMWDEKNGVVNFELVIGVDNLLTILSQIIAIDEYR